MHEIYPPPDLAKTAKPGGVSICHIFGVTAYTVLEDGDTHATKAQKKNPDSHYYRVRRRFDRGVLLSFKGVGALDGDCHHLYGRLLPEMLIGGSGYEGCRGEKS